MTDAHRAGSNNRTIEGGPTGLVVLRGMTAADYADRFTAETETTVSDRLSRMLDLLSDEERERLIARTVAFFVARRGPMTTLPFDE